MSEQRRPASDGPADGEPGDSTADAANVESPAPTMREAFRTALSNSGLAHVAPGEIPSAASLLAAVGGARGLIEAILPGLAFLVLYTVTRNLGLSVIVPVVVALAFVGARLVTRSPAAQALVGVLGVALSAGLALFTGRAEDNFVVGIWINVVALLIVLASLLARYPLIGLFVGILSNEGLDWRSDARKRRVLTLATLLWAGLFAVRLAAELPLYFAGQVEILAGVKLVLGVPFYAAMLWVTWLLVRSVYARDDATADSGER